MAKKKRTESSIINYLRNSARAGESKYMRNGRKWYNSSDWSPSNNISNSPLGWVFDDQSADWFSGPTPKVNVAKSAIDSLVARAARNKVRPIFTPKKGTFGTRRAIKSAQRYIDNYFYQNNVTQKIVAAFEYSCIFDKGWIFLNTWTKKCYTLAPWEIGVINQEFQYNSYGTKCLVSYRNYPCTQLEEYGIDNIPEQTYCLFEIYYDTEEHVTKLFIDKREIKKMRYPGSKIPVLPYFYNRPLNGFRSSSLLDDMLPLQYQLDINITKIKDASHSTPMNTIFVPEGTGLDVTQLSAGAGNVIHYRPTPGAATDPIKVATPAPVDQFYIQWHQQIKDDIYNMAGVSEMSAQSQKPKGLDSGVALETMEDIESARFQVQMDQIIRSHVLVALLLIDAYDEDEEILPEETMRDELKWKDLKKEIDKINIQFTAASSLSNDPEKQMQLLKEMSQLGLIDESRVAEMMELPDEEGAFADSGALPDAVDKVIQETLKTKDRPKIPIFVDYISLRDRIVLYQNKFYALDGDHKDEILRLQELFNELEPLLPQVDAQQQEEGPKVADAEAGFAVQEGLNPGNVTRTNIDTPLSGDPELEGQPLNEEMEGAQV